MGITKFKHKIPIILTLVCIGPYVNFILEVLGNREYLVVFSKYIYIIFPTVFIIGFIWANYFINKKQILKRAICVNVKDILEDYSKSESLSDYKYMDRYVKLTGTFKSINKIDKDFVEIDLLSDDTYTISVIGVLVTRSYLKYLKSLSEGDEITVNGKLFREDNILQLFLEMI